MICRHPSASTGRESPGSRAPERPAAQLPKLALGLALALGSPEHSPADTIHLKGGRLLEAVGCTEVGQELRCRLAGGTVGIPLDQVEGIEKAQGPAPRSPAPRRPRQADRPAQPPPPLAVEPGSTEDPLDLEAATARLEALSAQRASGGPVSAAIDREIALLHARMGHGRVLAGDYDGAESHYLRSLDHQPDLMIARLNLATLMINLSRYDEAERILADVLSDEPDNGRALYLMGESLFREGRLQDAIELWERARGFRPTGDLEARLDRARRMARAEESYHRSDAAHFSLKFDGEEASPEIAAQVLRYLERSHGELSARFLHAPRSIILVTLYPRRAFHDVTDSPSWVGGLFDGQIRIPIGGLTRLDRRAERVLIHELTHCFIASKTRGLAPQWIHEGIAQVVEGSNGSASRRGLLGAYREEGPPSGAEFTYPKALSQVEFFLVTWSDSHLNDVLDHLGRRTDIDAAMRAVTGLSFAEFLSAWADWLEGSAAGERD